MKYEKNTTMDISGDDLLRTWILHHDFNSSKLGGWKMKIYDPFEYDDVITLCDIVNSCDDCPRYGDDCDGRFDEEEEYYVD